MGEMQASVIGRVWAGTLGMNEVERADAEGSLEQELERLYQGKIDLKTQESLQAMKVGGREQGAFTHLLGTPRDLWLVERLGQLCQLADSGGGSGKGQTVMPWYGDYPVFSPYLKRLRSQINEIRIKHDSVLAEGREITTLTQLGFGEEEFMRGSKLMN